MVGPLPSQANVIIDLGYISSSIYTIFVLMKRIHVNVKISEAIVKVRFEILF